MPNPTKRPWYSPYSLLRGLVIGLLIVYIGFCMFLASMQTSLLYPMSTARATLTPEQGLAMAGADGLIEWDHPTPDSQVPKGFVRPDFTQPTARGTIVVFHGNGGYAWDRKYYVDAFRPRGFRTFLYEYPGYGGRPGRPSEATIVPDARALIRSLDQAGYGPVYVWGESLGSGVAASVCADPTLPVHGLVLLTPWDNLANVGLSLYPYVPVRLLLIDKYDSVANLQHFPHPICVVRSTHDEIIPPPLSINLFAKLPEPKKVITHEGYGHNDWPSTPNEPWWDDALNFIAPPIK